MKFSLTKNQYDNQPITADMSWQELTEGLRVPLVTHCHPCPSLTILETGKKSHDKCEARKVGMFGAQVFDGQGKKLANVVSISFLMFDIDHKPRAHIAAILDAVERDGLESIAYSTHSHDPAHDDYCFRLLLPLTQPIFMKDVGQERYRAFYKAVADQLGIDFDGQTKDQTRLVFQPTVPEGGPKYLFATTHGKSVDYFEAAPMVSGATSGPVEVVNEDTASTGAVSDIGELFKAAIQGCKDPEIRAAIIRSRDGKEIAAVDSHQRDNTIYRMASSVVFSCGNADIYSLLELFRPGCNAMAPRQDPDGMTWLGKAEFDLERAIERRDLDRAEKAAEHEVACAAGYRASVAAIPDDSTVSRQEGPYTEEDLQGFYRDQGCKDAVDFQKRWVIRYKGGNWIFENGRYGRAISDEDMDAAVYRNLKRSGIKFTKTTKEGLEVEIPWQKALNKDYTSQAECGVEGSLLIDRSFYDAKDRVFREAVCPKRNLSPEYNADVEEWLRRFKSDRFLDWLAAFSTMSRSTALLYIDGPKGIGKTLLPTALSRLWTKKGPASFANVIGTPFNDQLTQCPLIFADEEVPKTPGIMAKIRANISNPNFSLNRKFMPTTTVEGKLRYIISGNDEEILNTTEQINSDGIAAVSDRILYLKADASPGEWIRYLVANRPRGVISAWVDADVVIKHVLWLTTQRPFTEEGTLERTVGGGSKTYAEQLTVASGGVPAVLEFLARYVSEPSGTQHPSKFVIIGKGELLVSTELMTDKALWERFAGAHRMLAASNITKAMQQIRESDREVNGRFYHVMRVTTLLDWMRKNQVGNYRDAKARIEGVS